MVHDPRVTQQLSRLGGVYRDPNRVDRDASAICRSNIGSHLQPICAEFFDNNGNGSNVLVLQGTIAIHFRGQTYQQLVDVYLPPQYPVVAPIPFVRLANEDMYLKENHKHVANDGRVYMPYLHEWEQRTHNLIEMVVAMSSVFSADPPVYTRQPQAAARTTNGAAAAAVQQDPEIRSSMNMEQMKEAAEVIRQRYIQEAEREHQQRQEERLRFERQRMEEKLAREAQEAREAAEAAARREQEEEERKIVQLSNLRGKLSRHMNEYLTQKASELDMAQRDDLRDEQRLLQSRKALDEQIAHLKQRKDESEKALEDISTKKEAIVTWLEEAERAASDQERSADDMIVPLNHLHQQMFELSAENAAIEDALYFVDRALYRSNLSLESHLKEVRKLAKRQFLVRAHLIKINQILIDRKNSSLP